MNLCDVSKIETFKIHTSLYFRLQKKMMRQGIFVLVIFSMVVLSCGANDRIYVDDDGMIFFYPNYVLSESERYV